MQRRAQATRLALGLGRGAGEVARAWVSGNGASWHCSCRCPSNATQRRKSTKLQHPSWLPFLVSSQLSAAHRIPIPVPRKNHPHTCLTLLQQLLLPIPPPPLSRITTEFCTFPNRISLSFTTETASPSSSSSCSSSTSSPSYIIIVLAAPDEDLSPPDAPRPCQKEASLSLIAILHRLSPPTGAHRIHHFSRKSRH